MFNTTRVVKAYAPIDAECTAYRKVLITVPYSFKPVGRRVWRTQANGKKKPVRAMTLRMSWHRYAQEVQTYGKHYVKDEEGTVKAVPFTRTCTVRRQVVVKRGITLRNNVMYKAFRFKRTGEQFSQRRRHVRPDGQHYLPVLDIYSGVLQPWSLNYGFIFCNYAEVGCYYNHVSLDNQYDDTFTPVTRKPVYTGEFTTAPRYHKGKFFVEMADEPTPFCVIGSFTQQKAPMPKHRKYLLGQINSINNPFYTPTETTRPYGNCDVTVLRQGERFEVEEYDKSVTKYEVNAMLHTLIKEAPDRFSGEPGVRLCGENYLRKHRTGMITNSELLDFEARILKTRDRAVEDILKDLDRLENETCEERLRRAQEIAELMKPEQYDRVISERTPTAEAYEASEQARLDEFYSKPENACRTLKGDELVKAKKELQERYMISVKESYEKYDPEEQLERTFYPSPNCMQNWDNDPTVCKRIDGGYADKTPYNVEYRTFHKTVGEGDDAQTIYWKELVKVHHTIRRIPLMDPDQVDALLGDAGYDSYSRHEIEDVTYNSSGVVSYESYMQDSDDSVNESEGYEDTTDL